MDENKNDFVKDSKDPKSLNYSKQRTGKTHIKFVFDKEKSQLINSKLVLFLTIIEGIALIVIIVRMIM